MSRQVRVETRSRHQNDLKRVMHSTEKVRKWEKKWVRIEETSLQIFKWMPITKNEEQQRQQLQQQISAPVSTETLLTAGQETSYAQKSDFKKDQENIQARSAGTQVLTSHSTSHSLGANTSIQETPSTTASGVATTMTNINLNGTGDNRKPRDLASDETMSTVPSTLHSNNNNPNKRPHDDSPMSKGANESTHSPNSKRAKTSGELLTGITNSELVDSQSTLAAMHSAHTVPMTVPTASQPPIHSAVQHSNLSAIITETSHPQPVEGPLTTQQQHVQPSTTTATFTTTPAYETRTDDCVVNELAAQNGAADIEMMETEDMIGQQQPQPALDETLMEDFSSIARNVTEQIVMKVSDCYGSDN